MIIDASIIIFILTLLGITWMFVSQRRKLSHDESLGAEFSSKDLSYENFKLLNERAKLLWLQFIHATAIVISKLWARLTHHAVSWFHKGVRRVEEQMIKQEKRYGSDHIANRSVFLTTIKTYKGEIKKLRGKVEEELPRPRIADEAKNAVDNGEDLNTIDESSLGKVEDKPE